MSRKKEVEREREKKKKKKKKSERKDYMEKGCGSARFPAVK